MKIDNMYFGASPEIFRRAKELRKNMTNAEKILWEELKDKKLGGLKFRNQHPISKYILDFYCHNKKIGIEIDGEIHNDKARKFYDTDRTENLYSFGIKIIIFKNEEIFNNIEDVKKKILSICNEIED